MNIRPKCLLLNNVTRHDREATHMKSQRYLCLHRNCIRPYQLTWQCIEGGILQGPSSSFSFISSCFPALGSSGRLGHNLHLVWFGQTGRSYPLWMCRTLQDCPSPVHFTFTLSLIQTIMYAPKDGSPLSHAYLHTHVWHKMVLWGDFSKYSAHKYRQVKEWWQVMKAESKDPTPSIRKVVFPQITAIILGRLWDGSLACSRVDFHGNLWKIPQRRGHL